MAALWFPSLAKEGLGVVRSISEQISADVDRTTLSPPLPRRGIRDRPQHVHYLCTGLRFFDMQQDITEGDRRRKCFVNRKLIVSGFGSARFTTGHFLWWNIPAALLVT